MKTEQIIQKQTVETEAGNRLTVEYVLTCERTEADDPQYGIAVRARCGTQTEQIEAANLTPDLLRAAALVRSLAEGQVTPCTVMDILQDWL